MGTDFTPAMGKVINVDESRVRQHLDRIVKGTVEETLNAMLDAEADQVKLKVPKLRTLPFETAIIERYRRREASVEEALMEMYLAGVSVRRVEDITEALWGNRVSAGTVSRLNQKVYERIETWRNRPIEGEHPYVYLDGLVLKCSWGGEVCNVSVLVAIGVNTDGFRQVLGIAEGAKEDRAGWSGFLAHLKQRGLSGTQLFISDACIGLIESLGEHYPEARWQRCVVHFYRNVFSVVPNAKIWQVAAMLKVIHAAEDREAARVKAEQVIAKLKTMKLPKAAEKVEASIEETLAYYSFPETHWRRIRTNNPLERLMREIRRRTKVVGAFPDGHSALMLAAARLRHIAGTTWGIKRYLNMELLQKMAQLDQAIA